MCRTLIEWNDLYSKSTNIFHVIVQNDKRVNSFAIKRSLPRPIYVVIRTWRCGTAATNLAMSRNS